ncbi:hypothetical protein JCM14469_17480 [Desulfatiferula olefinivorans]
MSVRFFRKGAIIPVALAAVVAVLVLAPVKTALAETNTLLVLDASGSMRGRIDDTVKMDMAKDVLCDYIETLPADMNVGLVAYGHRHRDDCKDVEYLVPLGKNNHDLLVRTIRNLKPMGKTPITLSLEKAAAILDKKPNDSNSIILVSDGKESCDADPCALITAYMAQGKPFISHVIGFDVDARARKELECIAAAGKGTYQPVDDLGAFRTAFQNVKKTVPPAPTAAKAPTRLKSGALSLQKNSFTSGERIWVHFSTPDAYSDNAWIGIIPSHVPHGREAVNDEHDVSYQYLNKARTGDLEFYAPGTPGSYDFRMHDTDENGVEVASVSFQVTRGAATLTLPKTDLISGEVFQVHFTAHTPLTGKAWLGIVPSEIPHGSEERNDDHDVAYQYLDGKPMGTLTFNAPTRPGSYDMRLHDNDDKGTEIASVTFTVAPASGSVTLAKTTYRSGEKISVTFSTPPNLSPSAWIGIIPSDIPHGSEARNDEFDVTYQHLSGKSSGVLEFVAPAAPGSYDFRLNDSDDDGNELASVSFTVVPATGSLVLNKTRFARGERIWLTVKTSVPFASNAWVGIVPADIPHGSEERNDDNDISYQYVQGKTEFVLEFTAPDQPGAYDFRLNDSDGGGNEIASVAFTVN